jgi:RNA polymerase sigma-70 factor (family 1)
MAIHARINDEKQLLHRLIAGDPTAFEQFFHAYKKTTYHFVLRLTGSDAVAEELTHDVFLKIWDTREQLDPDRSAGGYLHTLARNHVFNHFREQARRERLTGEAARQLPVSTDEDPLVGQEYEQLTRDALALLPPKRREVFERCRFEEKSYEEVATEFGITRDAVKDHMVKAGKLLRAVLRRHLDVTLLLAFLFR